MDSVPNIMYLVVYMPDGQNDFNIINPKTSDNVAYFGKVGSGHAVVNTVTVENHEVAILATRPDAGFTIKTKKSWFSRNNRISFRYQGPCTSFERGSKFEWRPTSGAEAKILGGKGHVFVHKANQNIWSSYVPKGLLGGELRTIMTLESTFNDAHEEDGTVACSGEIISLMLQSMISIVYAEYRLAREQKHREKLEARKQVEKAKQNWEKASAQQNSNCAHSRWSLSSFFNRIDNKGLEIRF